MVILCFCNSFIIIIYHIIVLNLMMRDISLHYMSGEFAHNLFFQVDNMSL